MRIVQKKINDLYCFMHITALKLFEGGKPYTHNGLVIKTLTPKNIEEITSLFSERIKDDTHKCPMSGWDTETILRNFRYGFYLGMYKEERLISVMRVYMHHWFTIETSAFFHPEFRNRLYGLIFLFYSAEFAKKLKIKTLYMTAMEETTAVARITQYREVKKLPSPEGKVIMEINIAEMCEHSYNPLRKKE